MSWKRDIGCAIATGVLVCLSFPAIFGGWHLPEMGWLAWIALVPLLMAIRQAPPSRAFLLAFLAGGVFFGGSVYWVYRAMHAYGGLPASTSVAVTVLLVVFIAAYLALAPMAARFVAARAGGEFIAWLAVFWTAVEFARDHIPFNGFPWSNIAMSQWRLLPLIQIVDLVGVYGLIFLIVWVNAFLAEAAARLRGEAVRALPLKAAVTAALVVATLAYGIVRLRTPETPAAGSGALTVGMVQGNIPQEQKWVEQKAVEHLGKLVRLSRGLRDAPVDLIVWPEASLPWPVSTEARAIPPRVLGMEQEEVGAAPLVLVGVLSERPDGEYYNSMLLVGRGGSILGRYHKAHLVPFGEYVPYKKFFSFARKLTQPAGNFSEGDSFEPLVAGAARIGALICYEDVFPEIARALTARGADVLVNQTNDAWYGFSGAAYQHLALSVFRAVENRRFMVRATNSGVSAIVSPSGRVGMETGLFEEAVIVAPVALRRELAVYTRLGDWFAWGCVAYAGFGLIMALVLRVRRRT
jgi:apolipoprotein N-acyltransferase